MPFAKSKKNLRLIVKQFFSTLALIEISDQTLTIYAVQANDYSSYDIGLDYQFTDVSPDHSYYVWAAGNIYINELSQHGYTLIKRQF